MRAVLVGRKGEPGLADVPEPTGPGEFVRVLACGLCGSDIDKLLPSFAGRVLGHEVVAETAGGQRVALVHHAPCGSCSRCLAGHETTCAQFADATIVPGGFAERVRATAWVELPDSLDDTRAIAVEPLACVLRGAERVPAGRVLVVGQGFIGRLFAAVLEWRGDEVFAVDRDPRREGRRPDGRVDAAVLCAPGGADAALEALDPGGTLLCFADPWTIPAERIYRRELTVVGSRSSTPRHMAAAVAMLPSLDLPRPTVLPLERFAEGLDLQRRGEALKVVFVP
ncbi:MAG: alcohol dehydrogenase catalytic domain-containing protein [Gaiellaceae bacterium]